MRLGVLEHGHRLRARAFLRVAGATGGGGVDDVIKMILYRPEVLGRQFSRLARETMRGPSDWTPGERELFAAHISRLNTCQFCNGIHTQTARLGMGTDREPELADWRAGTFGPKVTAGLEFVEAVVTRPSDVTQSDVDRIRSAGVRDDAIEDILRVVFLFGVVNRLANVLDFSYGTEQNRLRQAGALHRFGYRLPGFLLA